MSIIEGAVSNQISIHLFDTGAQLKGILRTTFLNSQSALLVCEHVEFDDPSFSIGHLLGTTPRTCERNWEPLLDGTLNCLFVQFRDFVQVRSRLNLADVKIFIYKESVVTRVESLDASRIMVFLARGQFIRLNTTVRSFWTVAFNFSQSPAFTHMRQYARYGFVLMDHIYEIAVPEFPFLTCGLGIVQQWSLSFDRNMNSPLRMLWGRETIRRIYALLPGIRAGHWPGFI
jgi:hypothetical protein